MVNKKWVVNTKSASNIQFVESLEITKFDQSNGSAAEFAIVHAVVKQILLIAINGISQHGNHRVTDRVAAYFVSEFVLLRRSCRSFEVFVLSRRYIHNKTSLYLNLNKNGVWTQQSKKMTKEELGVMFASCPARMSISMNNWTSWTSVWTRCGSAVWWVWQSNKSRLFLI